MGLKTRTELETHFKNGRRPSQREFADLIGSMLNKRDDQFLGRWRAGTTYRTGDVVVYERGLWELKADADGEPQEICSHEPPEDGPLWQSLVVPVEDDDWFIVDLEEPPPAETSGEEGPPDLLPARMYANPRVRYVGIGTEEPGARLDAREAGHARVLLLPKEVAGAVVTLLYEREEVEQNYLLVRVDDEEAALVSDAPGGFVFRHGEDCEPGEETRLEGHAGELLVVIQADGRVGVGTPAPYTRLEVTNGTSGRFLFNLDRKVNPALGIVNAQPGSRENYLAVGADNDAALFVTDSDFGFVFRHGGRAGEQDNEIDINQGRTLLALEPEGTGKLGVGRQPDDYQLDVHGLARAFTYYVDTDEANVTDEQDLDGVLDRVLQLRPRRFAWGASTGYDGEGTQIGLLAHEVDDYFPEAVKTNHDRTKAVAYHNLVAVLVKAFQEQQALLDEQAERLDDLEQRINDLEGGS